MARKTLKTIGILGGMGPAATADLLTKIVEMTDAGSDQKHIPVIAFSNSRIPDRTAAILHGGESPVPELVSTAKTLEAAGADFLIIPCNTAHYFLPEIQKETNIPAMHIAKATSDILVRRGVKKAAVLATDGTCQVGIYNKALESEGIEPLYPYEEKQKLIMSMIYDLAKPGITDPEAYPVEDVQAMVRDLREQGAEAMLLACTELPLCFDIMGLMDDNCIDTTRALAAAAIREAGANIRKEYNY